MQAVVVDEHVSFRLRSFLREEGYWAGSCIGTISSWDLTERADQFGLIIPPIKRYSRKFLWFKTRNRGQFIGVVWLNNSPRDASLKQWVIEVYGRENLSQLIELANKLKEEFNVPKIVVRLIDEQSRQEELPGDGSYL